MKYLLLVTLFLGSVSAYGQCTKMKYYPAQFETVTETIEVSPAYEKKVLVKEGYVKTETRKELIQDAYIDFVKGCGNGYDCAYKEVTVPAKYETITKRTWVDPVYRTTYVSAVTRTVVKKRKVRDAKVVMVTIDCD